MSVKQQYKETKATIIKKRFKEEIFSKACLIQRRRRWHPTPVLLPGKSHGRRSLVGCSPWGLDESDTTEQLPFHFSLSCIGEGNGNPLQCSCLENPRDRGTWWAAVYGVAQSRTWLSSSSSSLIQCIINTCNSTRWNNLWSKRYYLIKFIDQRSIMLTSYRLDFSSDCLGSST